MLGLGWDLVAGAGLRSRFVNNTVVRAVMLPAGAIVGLTFAALAVVALRRLPGSSDNG
jgi:hypothetical protein